MPLCFRAQKMPDFYKNYFSYALKPFIPVHAYLHISQRFREIIILYYIAGFTWINYTPVYQQIHKIFAAMKRFQILEGVPATFLRLYTAWTQKGTQNRALCL